LSEHGGVIEMRTLKVCHLKAVHQTQSMCPRKHSWTSRRLFGDVIHFFFITTLHIQSLLC